MTNEGNTDLTNVTLTDDLAGTATLSSGDNNSNNILNVGEVWIYTASYNATQADINNGTDLVNIASVTTTELPVAKKDTATTTITSNDSLSITKVVDQTTIAAPGTLNYTITVTNEGNTDLTNVTLTDDLAGTATLSSGDNNSNNILNVGEVWVYTASYNATQADINNGTDLVNIASVTTTELPVAKKDTATTTITSNDSLSITKVVDQTTIAAPGTLNYTITVINEGNTDLTNVTLTDDLAGTATLTSGDNNSNNILNVGEVWVYTASYNATQADINNGTNLVNIASVTTTELPVAKKDTATTTITSNDSLSITKVVDQTTIAAPGTLNYTITVINEGNTDLTNVTLTDDLAGSATLSSGDNNSNNILNVGEVWVYTATYAATQADINNGTDLVNIASVTTTELPVAKKDTATTSITSNDSLSITKVVDQTTIAAPGTLNYTITVINEGNTDLTNIQLTDDLAGSATLSSGDNNSNNILNVGEVWVYTASYAATQADIDKGIAIENIVKVRTNELPIEKSDSVSTVINFQPELSITKVANDTTLVYEGQIVTYTYVVTNVGNVSIKNVFVADVHNGSNSLSNLVLQSTNGTDDGIDNLVDSLAPGQNGIWTASYIVSAQDIANGIDIVNTATASGIPTVGVLVNPTAVEKITVGEFLVAVNDSSLNNPIGVPVVINIISNDTLSSGFNPTASQVSVDLNPSLPGIQNTLTVAGEGVYVYDSLTGNVTFTPEPTFVTDPSPIDYVLIEKSTGLDSTATIVITVIEEQPIAVNDSSLNNPIGVPVVINIISNDTLSSGFNPNANQVSVDLNPSLPGIQNTLTVAGEGVYVYDSLTGNVTFTPEPTFVTDPSPIDYVLIEKSTGLDSTATIVITVVEEQPIAVNDSSLNNPIGVPVVINIISNDTLSSGFNPNANQVSVDLNPSLPGIQNTLTVAGEGVYVYDSLTSNVTFTPEPTFVTDPSPIDYVLIEKSTGLDSTATIVITVVEEQPIAVNDSSLNNPIGVPVVINIISNDTLSSGFNPTASQVSVDLNPSLPGIQNTLTVAGEGVYVYDSLTGNVTFTPEPTFVTDPSPIDYVLIEKSTGLDSTATIVITVVEEQPIAVNDSSLNNPIGVPVVINIISNDTLSSGFNPTASQVSVDLNPSLPGIQNTLTVAGEGVYVYDSLTGNVTFIPEPTFVTDPSPIDYVLIEKSTGLTDQANIIITYIGADLSLTKSVNTQNVNVGDTLTFTINLRNSGPSVATNVQIKDALPIGYSNISNISSNGIYLNDTITWVINSLNVNADTSFTYNVVVNAPTGGLDEYKNVAQVTAADQVDPNSTPNNDLPTENDQDAVTPTLKQADLSLIKTISNSTPNVGDVVTFTIKVKNAGPDTATNVDIEDILPNGYSNIQTISGGGIYANDTIKWNNKTIANNDSLTFTYQARVNSPGAGISFTNVAQVTDADQFDPNSTPNNDVPTENDQDSVTPNLKVADLSIEKSINNSSPQVGEVVTFSIKIKNDGPDDANGVDLVDYLPNGFGSISNISNAGTIVDTTIIWNNLSVNNGDSLIVTFDAVVLPFSQSTKYTNTAEIIGSNQYDPDSRVNNFNGVIAEDEESLVCVFPGTLSDTTLCEGENLVFTIDQGQTYQWSGPNGFASTSSTFSLTNISSVNAGVYNVLITNGACSITKSFTLTVTGKPNVVVEATNSGCQGTASMNNGKITISGFAVGTNYQLSPGTVFNSMNATSLQSVPLNGIIKNDVTNTNQSFTVRVFNSNNCSRDYRVDFVEIGCQCPAEICIPFIIKKVK